MVGMTLVCSCPWSLPPPLRCAQRRLHPVGKAVTEDRQLITRWNQGGLKTPPPRPLASDRSWRRVRTQAVCSEAGRSLSLTASKRTKSH